MTIVCHSAQSAEHHCCQYQIYAFHTIIIKKLEIDVDTKNNIYNASEKVENAPTKKSSIV
jgi:hypothetical protein